MKDQDPAAGYDQKAAELADLYESLSFEESHEAALDLVPERPGLVLDVGAGSGRDAAWFAGRGWDVVAVEPAAGMRREGRQRHPRQPIPAAPVAGRLCSISAGSCADQRSAA